MSIPIWLTNEGDLGIIPEEEYYEFYFDAYNTGGGSLTYSLITGNLPVGLELGTTGAISGIPSGRIGGTPAAVSKVTTSTFTVRITNSEYEVADRTFSLTVAGILPQTIIPTGTSLGTYLDGTYFYADINTIEPNEYLESTFSIIAGELPPGVTLNSVTGVISGYIIPVSDSAQSASSGIFDADNVPYDNIPFNPSGIDVTKNYQFTIKADNGINIETQTYTILVVAITSVTADNEILTPGPSVFKADAIGIVTADILGPGHNPVILTEEGLLENVYQNSQCAIQIQALDFEGDDLTFELTTGTLPLGLSLNTDTGWITGYLPYNTLGISNFTFSIRCFKTSDPTYSSQPREFSIKILSQIADILTWDTPSDLGVIYTGQISELSISASVPSGRQLLYTLTDNYGSLPYGLSLTLTGLISGRVSFETFILDANQTTFDNNQTTFDRTFTFTVQAADLNNYVRETKTFTLRIRDLDQKPYENLYIQAFPSRDQRQIFNSIINNSDIFPDDYLYRLGDPWFGKNTERRSLFLAGLNPELASVYINSMQLNHYWKTITFGEVKTARAVDSTLSTRYEVVYIELIDSGVNEQGLGPNLSIDLLSNSPGISTIYPNSFPNMQKRLETGIGYENRSTLPLWMTSRQADGTVLGFTRALVLCYTLPGKSAEIAYNVQQEQSQFQFIDFTIDRYEWDSSLSNVYNKSISQYYSNNFVTGTGQISANTNSNIVVGLRTNIIGSGTIFGTAGTSTITGINTNFGSEVVLGKPIYNNASGNIIGTISSIQSATELKITEILPTSFANVQYIITASETEFIRELHVNDTLLVNNSIIGTIKTITSNTNLTLYTNSISNLTANSFTYTARDPVSVPGVGDKYLKYPQVGVIS
jgi:hypothetical protein